MFNTLPDSAATRMSAMDWSIPVGATSISGGIHGLFARMQLKCMPHWGHKIGNPRVEKVLQHRLRHFFGGVMKAADMKSVQLGSSRRGIAQPRQNKGAASLTKAHGAFRKIGEAVMASEPDACAGVGSPPAGNANHHRLQRASGH
jgi:hypothetical protein